MRTRDKNKKFEIFTVGHSTKPIQEFIETLMSHGVKRVIDVRSIPRSRHNPQFNRESLGPSLRAAGIAYTHLKKLGGLRHAKRDSINQGWRNASFRGFADYMQTPEFASGLERAEKLDVSEGTVRAHVTAILRKLNVSTRTQAAILVTEQDLERDSADAL